MNQVTFRFQDATATLRGMVERSLSLTSSDHARSTQVLADLSLPSVHGVIRPSDIRSAIVDHPTGVLADAIGSIERSAAHAGGVSWMRVVQPLEGAATVSFRAAGSSAIATTALEHAPAAIIDAVAAARSALRMII